MNRRARLGIILALALLVLLPAYIALRAFQTPTQGISMVPVWGWTHWAEWDYTVFLKPNTVYGTRQLAPDLTYYEALVEGIEARFSYTFAADTPVRIEGWYEVTAELAVGKLVSERTLVTPRTPFLNERGPSLTLELEFPIDRKRFRERVEEIAAEMGVGAASDATVTYTAHVETTAGTEAGSTDQVLEPFLIVPLAGQTFTLSGDRSQNEHGVIRRSQEESFPGVEAQRRYSLLAAGLLALLPVLFAVGTVARPRRVDLLAREVRRIRRKYRKRMAQLGPGQSGLPGEEAVPLGSIEDLARVSEELLKPIIHSGPADPGEPHIFFVVDGTTRYEYRLSQESPPGGGE